MAALRQLLNARGTEAKMAALGYQISAPQVPDKSESDRSRTSKTPDPGKPLHSKFNDAETPAWQHPLLRQDQPAAHNRQDSYGRSNSFDDYSQRPNHLLRTNTDTNMGVQGNRTDDSGFSMDVSSIYEDNESPALSPALNKHLALRPLNTQAINQTQEEPARSGKTRRRSRSATQESQPAYYGTDPWESYRKEQPSSSSASNPKRKESLAGVGGRSSSKPPEESSSMQLLRDRDRDRNRSPTQLQKHKYDPSSSPPNNVAVKVAHNTFSSTSSPTDSAGNSISEHQGDASSSHPHHPRNNKRKRSLDYNSNDLSSMDYVQDLQPESFDSFPALSQLASTHNLPSTSLPLSDRLRDIYNTPMPHSSNNAPIHPSNDKAARARAFFASLQIDQYEECGDLLLDGFRDVMDRLRQARREKRKAARGMEELVAKREEWVRRKRGVLEGELGRLRGAGVAVVKPISGRHR